tara:strand:- start:305 stop:589 length:285 start_codon:yes stop_codon:yes gene_type:complete
MVTRTNIYKIRYNENCLDFASSIANARYPERSETSQATSVQSSPIHDWTSHARTALEYLMIYLKENPLVEKKKIIDDRPRRDYATGKLVYPVLK